jgi:hypothetical protein
MTAATSLHNVHFKLIQGTQTTEHKLTQGDNMLTHTQDEVSASACIMTAYAVRLNGAHANDLTTLIFYTTKY